MPSEAVFDLFLSALISQMIWGMDSLMSPTELEPESDDQGKPDKITNRYENN